VADETEAAKAAAMETQTPVVADVFAATPATTAQDQESQHQQQVYPTSGVAIRSYDLNKSTFFLILSHHISSK